MPRDDVKDLLGRPSERCSSRIEVGSPAIF